MRIQELLESDEPVLKLKQTSDPIPHGMQVAGEGEHARVYINPHDPGVVVRKELEFTDPNDNGFYQWAKIIEQHQDSNPYLPKIYRIREERHPQDSDYKKYTYELQRLWPVKSENSKWSMELIDSLGDRLIKDWDSLKEQWRKSRPDRPEQLYLTTTKMLLIGMVNYIQERIWKNDYHEKLQDPLLIEAIDIVKNAHHNLTKNLHSMRRYDIHADNVMIRPTKSGPQLVITDPLN